MLRQIQHDGRSLRWGTIGLAAWLGMLLGAMPGLAADIVRVEEDWELRVATPDSENDAPQITCLFSPINDVHSVHAALELNQRSMPSFSPGGLQLQLWDGESPLAHVEAAAAGVLDQSDETVTWTQAMQVSGGVLQFTVTGGQSTTWGNFGTGELMIGIPTNLMHLNQYDPAVSAGNSAIGFAANRVRSLVLKQVRVYAATGEMVADTTPRPVYVMP